MGILIVDKEQENIYLTRINNELAIEVGKCIISNSNGLSLKQSNVTYEEIIFKMDNKDLNIIIQSARNEIMKRIESQKKMALIHHK